MSEADAARLFGDLTIAQAVVWGAAVLALIALVVKLWPIMRGLVALIDALSGLPRFMARSETRYEELEELLRDVKHEVLPNDGSSLRDESVTMGYRIESIEAKLARDYERLAALQAELHGRESRGIGIPTATDPRLQAHPSRIPFPADDTESRIDP